MTTNRATAAKGSFPYPGHRTCREWLINGKWCAFTIGGEAYVMPVQQSGFVDLPPRNTRQESPARRPKGEAKREWGMES